MLKIVILESLYICSSSLQLCYFLLFQSDISPKSDVTFKHIPVLQDSSAQELIQLTLQKFGIEVL